MNIPATLRFTDEQLQTALATALNKDDLLSRLEEITGRRPHRATVERRMLKLGLPSPAAYFADKAGEEPEEDTRPVAGGFLEAPDARRRKATGTRFIFTSAQNNTYLHPAFDSLRALAEYDGAQLHIAKFVYNKQGWQTGVVEGEDEHGNWYDPRLEPYLSCESLQITEDLVWCGELNILPTAPTPLNTLQTYTRKASGIVPHAKMHMVSVPTMKHDPAKFMYTTGTITLRNYIQKKVGQVAEFHHVFGALYVEVDEDGDWFARQLVADNDGTIYDLDRRITPEGVTTGSRPVAIVHGDIHQEKLDPDAAAVTWGEGGIMDTLRPAVQVIHDLCDFTRRNHHNIRDPHFLAERAVKGASVEDEIKNAAAFLGWIERDYCETAVVESNHDTAINLWVKNPAGQMDPENAAFWHECNARVIRSIREGDDGYNLFRDLLDEYVERNRGFIFVAEDESYVIDGVEFGLHGHLGPNGARGNPKNLRVVGKANTAHTHSAGIIDGVYTAGVLGKLDMGYNKGPSAWSHSSILQHPNGKRQIITIKNGKWRA